ncbi:hypothetical protein D3C77_779710 [compost metagenome]
MQQHLAGYIGEGIARGEIRADVEPMAGSTLILGALRGSMLQFLLDPGDIPLSAIRQELLAFVEHALAIRSEGSIQ